MDWRKLWRNLAHYGIAVVLGALFGLCVAVYLLARWGKQLGALTVVLVLALAMGWLTRFFRLEGK